MDWVIKQYINDSGNPVFSEWMEAQSPAVQAKIHATLDYLMIQPFLRMPYAKKLSEVKKIWELRVERDNVQYRPLFCVGPGRNELCFLIGATKTGDKDKTKWEPLSAPRTAEKRYGDVLSDPEKYVGEYERP